MKRRDAIISDCGRYRYALSRHWGLVACPRMVTWLMLNPSTADASIDDQTIRRCIDFSKSWGCDGMQVLNLYALRSPRPSDLWLADDPVGPENDRYIQNHCSDVIVCAWGINAKPDRVLAVYKLLHGCAPLTCLGVTKNGAPKHPLYIKRGTPLRDWRPPQGESEGRS